VPGWRSDQQQQISPYLVSAMQQQQQFTYAPGFQFLRCGWDGAAGQIGHIELNRPAASNAFNAELWQDFPKVHAVVAFALN
jgi:hypothetical protein